MNICNLLVASSRFVRISVSGALLLFASSVFAGPDKILVCHVDDLGKVNLIVVSPNSKHLGNPAHVFGDLSDYAPDEVGASGSGTEDSDGNGVDDGCEPSLAKCPCWAQIELQSVNNSNIATISSCKPANYPAEADLEGGNPYQGGFFGFFASNQAKRCGKSLNPDPEAESIVFYDLTTAEADACVEQIAVRCDELERSIWPQP